MLDSFGVPERTHDTASSVANLPKGIFMRHTIPVRIGAGTLQERRPRAPAMAAAGRDAMPAGAAATGVSRRDPALPLPGRAPAPLLPARRSAP